MESSLRASLSQLVPILDSEDGSLQEDDIKYNQKIIADCFVLLRENLYHHVPVIGERKAIFETKNLDLLVIFAEACFKAKNYDTCRTVLNWYFDNSPQFDELYMRGTFCLANLNHYDIRKKGLKGKELVDGIIKCLQLIIKASKFGLENLDRYSLLIHESSVHFWNISRSVNHDGNRKNLIDSWQFFVDTLQKINDNITWRIRFSLQLALALDEADQQEAANKIVTAANDMNTKQNSSETEEKRRQLQNKIFRIQIFLSRKTKKGTPVASGGAVTKIIGLVQSLRSGLLDKQQDKEASDALSALKSESTPKVQPAAKKKGEPDPPLKDIKPQYSEDALVALGMLGVECCMQNLAAAVVKEVVHILDSSKNNLANIYSEYIKSLIGFCEVNEIQKQDKAVVQEKLKYVKMAERALNDSIKFKNGDLIQEGAVIVWNQCLPLLQSTSRQYIRKSLQTIVDALESVDSNSLLLKTAVRFEISKCDISAEVFLKAKYHLDKAANTNYVVSQEDQLLYNLERPLDRFVIPTKEELDLKIDSKKVPETMEEEAFLVIEQAKEALDKNVKERTLNRAISYLHPKPNQENNSLSDEILRKRYHLWSLILKESWAYQLIHPMRAAILSLEQTKPNTGEWSIVRDKEYFTHLSMGYMYLAESHLIELSREHGVTIFDMMNLRDDPECKDVVSLIHEAQAKFLQFIEKGVSVASSAKLDWAVYNGSIYLWNYLLDTFEKQQRYAPFLTTLEKCVSSLLDCLLEKHPKIISKLSCALISAYLQQFLIEKRSLNHETVDYNTLLPSIYSESNVNSELVKKALQLCDKVITTIGTSPFMLKDVFHLKAKIIKITSGKTPPLTGSDFERLSTYVEIFQMPIEESEKIKYINEALPMLTSKANPEFCYLFSLTALHCREYKTVFTICDIAAKLLPEGIRNDTLDTLNFDLTAKQWRWHCLCVLNTAQATFYLLNLEKQNQKMQLEILLESLSKHSVSISYSLKTNDRNLTLQVFKSSMLIISTLKNYSEAIRISIIPFLSKILRNYSTVELQTTEEKNLAEAAYSFILLCFKQTSQFKNGLSFVEIALKHLPFSHHMTILKFEIEFRKLLGKNVNQAFQKLLKYDAVTRASITQSIALSSHTPVETRDYFVKAIDELSGEPTEQAKCMLDYCEWLLSNYSNENRLVNTLIRKSIDVITNLDNIEQLQLDQDDSKSSRTRSSHGSSMKSTSKRFKAHSKTSGSVISKGVTQQQETESLIEQGPLNVTQLDCLARALLMQAITSTSYEQYISNLLAAHFCYIRVLVSCFDYFDVMRQVAKFEFFEPGELTKKLLTKPNTIEEWFDYDIDDRVVDAWQKDLESNTKISPKNSKVLMRKAVNATSIDSPSTTIFYLTSLGAMLTAEGLHGYVVPLLQIELIISKGILKNSNIVKAIYLKQAHIFETLGLLEQSLKCKRKAEPIIIPESLQKSLKEERDLVSKMNIKRKPSSKSTYLALLADFQKGILRKYWIEQSHILTLFGDISNSFSIVSEVQQDSQTQLDDYSLTGAELELLRILRIRGYYSEAFDIGVQIKSRDITLEHFSKCVIEMIQLLIARNELDKAKSMINACFNDMVSWFETHKQPSVLYYISKILCSCSDQLTALDSTSINTLIAHYNTLYEIFWKSNDICYQFGNLTYAESVCVLKQCNQLLLHGDFVECEQLMNLLIPKIKNTRYAIEQFQNQVYLSGDTSILQRNPLYLLLCKLSLILAQTCLSWFIVDAERGSLQVKFNFEKQKSIVAYPKNEGGDNNEAIETLLLEGVETNYRPMAYLLDESLSMLVGLPSSNIQLQKEVIFTMAKAVRLKQLQNQEIATSLRNAISLCLQTFDFRLAANCCIETIHNELLLGAAEESVQTSCALQAAVAQTFEVANMLFKTWKECLPTQGMESFLLRTLEHLEKELTYPFEHPNYIQARQTLTEQSLAWKILQNQTKIDNLSHTKIASDTLVLSIHLQYPSMESCFSRPSLYGSLMVNDPEQDNPPEDPKKAKAPPKKGEPVVEQAIEPRKKTFFTHETIDVTSINTLTRILEDLNASLQKELTKNNADHSKELYDNLVSQTELLLKPILSKLQEELHFQLYSKNKKKIVLLLGTDLFSRIPCVEQVLSNYISKENTPLPLIVRDFSFGIYLQRLQSQAASQPSSKGASSATGWNWTKLVYLIDPLNQVSSQVSSSFMQMLNAKEAANLKTFKGLSGRISTSFDAPIPDATEMQNLLLQAETGSYFVYLGYGNKFVKEIISPEKISTSDFGNSKCMILLEETEQQEQEAKKNSLSDAVIMAAILTLRNASTIVVNLLPNRMSWNSKVVETIIEKKDYNLVGSISQCRKNMEQDEYFGKYSFLMNSTVVFGQQ